MLTFGSLFAGIGGFDLGLERAGMRCAWQVEIDPFCQRVLAKHWPTVERFFDVRQCGRDNLKPVDVICGGFPCQPHSLAGKRQSSNDERDLWGEFARVIREIKPRWVLAENVSGLLSSENGRFFGNVLRDLAESGYDAEWNIVPAFSVGAPHIRERVFVIAHAYGNRLQENIFKRELLDKSPAFSRWNGHTARSGGNVFTRWGWSLESAFVRVGDGVSSWVDRSKSIGNSICPQVAEFLGQCVLQAENGLTTACTATGGILPLEEDYQHPEGDPAIWEGSTPAPGA